MKRELHWPLTSGTRPLGGAGALELREAAIDEGQAALLCSHDLAGMLPEMMTVTARRNTMPRSYSVKTSGKARRRSSIAAYAAGPSALMSMRRVNGAVAPGCTRPEFAGPLDERIEVEGFERAFGQTVLAVMRDQQLAVHEEDVRLDGREPEIEGVEEGTGAGVVVVGVGAVEGWEYRRCGRIGGATHVEEGGQEQQDAEGDACQLGLTDTSPEHKIRRT